MTDQELLKKQFDYVNGKLWYKQKEKHAGWLNNTGYLRMSFKGTKILVHQVVFLWHYGYIPKMLDHINGNRLDNRIENLRECSPYENQLNSKTRVDNKSGCRNVSFSTERNQWNVRCNVQGKRKYIGIFEDLELACLVAEEARDKFNKGFIRHD